MKFPRPQGCRRRARPCTSGQVSRNGPWPRRGSWWCARRSGFPSPPFSSRPRWPRSPPAKSGARGRSRSKSRQPSEGRCRAWPQARGEARRSRVRGRTNAAGARDRSFGGAPRRSCVPRRVWLLPWFRLSRLAKRLAAAQSGRRLGACRAKGNHKLGAASFWAAE